MSNRSGSPYSVPRDANRVPFLVAASTADGITPVVLEADPSTHLLQVSSSGGWSSYFANAITTVVTVSSTAGKFGGYMLINLNTAPAYLQVFDLTTTVTLGTTVPKFVIALPANATAVNGIAANLELVNGAKMTNGIQVAATTTSNGATPVSTGLSGSIWYL